MPGPAPSQAVGNIEDVTSLRECDRYNPGHHNSGDRPPFLMRGYGSRR